MNSRKHNVDVTSFLAAPVAAVAALAVVLLQLEYSRSLRRVFPKKAEAWRLE
jgi:hypothetical protein